MPRGEYACTFLGAFIMRSIVFKALYWDPSICGNYHVGIIYRDYKDCIRVYRD